MGKLIEAVRKLGNKLTGKQTVESNSLVKVINDIADDYEGGGGTDYTAGDGITINNNVISNNLAYALTEINSTDTSISKSKLRHIVDSELFPIYGSIDLHISETDKLVALNLESYEDTEDGVTCIWTSNVVDNKYYKLTFTASSLESSVPCTIEEKTVGVPSSYLARLYARVNGYTVDMVFNVNDNTLETYADLVNYFLNIGMDEDYYIPASGYDSELGAITGIGLGYNEETQTDAISVVAVYDTPDTYLVEDDESFEITYLGN